jgi:predicted dehydrogenase
MKTRSISRRQFIRASAVAATAAASASEILPRPGHLAENNTIQLALIGCGGRGSGAIGDAIQAKAGPVQLVAMADLFSNRLEVSRKTLSTGFPEQVNVPPERCFLGFDAYRKAIDCLRPGDIAVLGTHAAFRAAHLEYAVGKGVNIFMEKSFAPDPAGIQKILSAGAEAEKRNLKIGTGLMCRHSAARQEMIGRIRDNAMGEVHLVRAYRMDPGDRMGPVPKSENELHWQIRHPYFFFWVSTGRFIDYLIHQVDECCWIKDGWPVSAQGLGGRAPDSTDCGQNLDSYAIEYTFGDGTKALVNGRFIPGCDADFATFVHGTKCAGQFSGNVHAPVTHLYKDQRIDRGNIAWRAKREPISPYVAEWEALLRAILNDQPYNETRRAALANLVAIMGRAAVHSGKTVTFNDAMSSRFEFCGNVNDLTDTSPAPAQADPAGRYAVPVPGVWRET